MIHILVTRSARSTHLLHQNRCSSTRATFCPDGRHIQVVPLQVVARDVIDENSGFSGFYSPPRSIAAVPLRASVEAADMPNPASRFPHRVPVRPLRAVRCGPQPLKSGCNILFLIDTSQRDITCPLNTSDEERCAPHTLQNRQGWTITFALGGCRRSRDQLDSPPNYFGFL